MNKFKTKQASGTILNSVAGELRVLAERDGWKQKVELWLLNDITNRNNWRYERLEEHKKLFSETPILVAYVGDKVGDSHNFDKVYNDDGTVTASFMDATAERIVGFFKGEEDIRIEERNGEKWIVGVGWIWQWYAQELVAKLKKQGIEGMSVSIETLVSDSYKQGTTEVFTKYQVLGTTILGDDVAPAVAGANIRALSAIGAQEVRNITLRVASLQQQNNPQQNNKKEKRTTMNIKDLAGKFNGYTVLGVDGNNVALLSKDGAYLATCSVDNGEVVEGAKNRVNATVVMGEGDSRMELALDSVIAEYEARNAKLAEQLDKKTAECETITVALNKMQTQETARRREAVINAIKNRIAEIKANSDADIADNECDDLYEDATRLEAYIAMEDCDGKFIGDEKACADVDTRCMSKILAQNKVKANAQKKTYAWNKDETDTSSGTDNDSLQSLIDDFTK